MTRGVSLALACAFVAAALLFARPASTPGPALRDFEAYWSAGAAFNAHEDPYGRAVWNAERTVPGVDATRDELLPFVGPPATLPMWSAFARLPYATAARVWWTLLALALLCLLLLLARAASGAIAPFSVFALIVFALGFGPMTSDLALGQIALLALLGAAACVCLANVPLAAFLGAFVAYFQPNVALGLLSQLGRNRTTLLLLGAGFGTYFVGVAGAGWDWPVTYASILTAHAAAERFNAIQISPAAIAFGFGAPERIATAFGLAVAGGTIVAGFAIVRSLSTPFERFAAASALVPLVAGFFHEHDLIVAFPAAVWCAFNARGSTRVFATVGTMFVAIDWLGLAQRPTGLPQSMLLAAAALCVLVALSKTEEARATLAAGLLLIALVGLAAWLAARHPMPVWPDTLAGFHVASRLSPAAVWNAEQHVAGLDIRELVWALLRMLSLLGCALLTASIYRQGVVERLDIHVHHVVEG
jgi:hypothetical protein